MAENFQSTFIMQSNSFAITAACCTGKPNIDSFYILPLAYVFFFIALRNGGMDNCVHCVLIFLTIIIFCFVMRA